MNIGNNYISKKQIIFFIILSAGLIASIYLVLNRQIFKSRASVTNMSFTIIQDTNPQQPAVCEGETCTTRTLNVVIKLNLPDESQSPIAARINTPASKIKVDPSVGYYIPFKNASVKIANPEAAKKRLLAQRPNAQIENWDTIVSESEKAGFNPAFMIALWVEESGAQGEAGYADAFGCEPGNPTTDINKSLGCVFKSFGYLTNDRFGDLMCIYGGDRFHNSPCTFDVANPNFPENIRKVYSELVPSGNGAIVY